MRGDKMFPRRGKARLTAAIQMFTNAAAQVKVAIQELDREKAMVNGQITGLQRKRDAIEDTRDQAARIADRLQGLVS
jgi:hypothetical protein